MPNYDDWNITPARVYMHPDDYRDIVVWTLMEEGWSESDALAEADRRLAEMLPPPGEPDPIITEMAQKLVSGEG